MKSSRLAAVVSALVVLLGPVVTALPAQAEPTVATQITLAGVHTATYGDTLTITGQVVYTDPGDNEQYALEGATVVLARRYLDSSTWTEVGSVVTSGFWPAYEFTQKAVRNAVFRVTFAGDATYQASTNRATGRVRRIVSSRGTEPRENVFYLSGRVRPAYDRKRVDLMRKTCSACSWKVSASQRTTATSRFRFRLPLPPRSQTHYFRVRVPGGTSYITSYSTTYQLTRLLRAVPDRG